jgi:predicted transposase/invertase (TIGR01784 family)
MRIINPLYDLAFKYLMDNEPIARKILSVILEQEVLSLQSKPQETPLLDKKNNITVTRFDFKAIIRGDDQKEKNVLIEIQKSRNPDPIMRFRRYLGKNYIRKETFTDENGKETHRAVPIITIYILGYELPEYDTPAILVSNQVIDATTKIPFTHKNEFVEMLTHPSYILQTKRLKPERKTKIEKFLSFFDQTQRTDDDFILEIADSTIGEFDDIAHYLNLATLDEEILRSLEYEEDYEQSIDKLEEQLGEAKRQSEEERKQKEEKEKTIVILIKKLHQKGFSESEIAEDTGKSVEEVRQIILEQ